MESVHPPSLLMPVVSATWWDTAITFERFVHVAVKYREFWQATFRTASIPESARLRAAAIDRPLRLLAINEDWCGDSVNTLPVIQRVVDANPLLELRVTGRDANPALMDAHLSGTARAIPVVIVMDETGRHLGWWGSRPAPLQRWRSLEGDAMEKTERYKATRTWYARDRGRTTADEILTLLERAAGL